MDNVVPEARLLSRSRMCAALPLPLLLRRGEPQYQGRAACLQELAKLGQSSAAVTRWGIKAPSSGRGVDRCRECYI